MKKFLFFFFLFKVVADFSPQTWLFLVLRSHILQWNTTDFQVHVDLNKDTGRIIVWVDINRNLADFDRKWKKKVEDYLRFLHPRIVMDVKKYATFSYRQRFLPQRDLEYIISLESLEYGRGTIGKIRWKRGIY